MTEEDFSNVNAIFKNAIRQGKLSLDENADNWVGNYMYMYSRPSLSRFTTIDHFKNRTTREYDVTVTRDDLEVMEEWEARGDY